MWKMKMRSNRSFGHGARRSKRTSEALEGSSTRLTRKANRRELENGQSKTFRCMFLFETPRTLRGHPPGPRTPSPDAIWRRQAYIASAAADTRGQSIYSRMLCADILPADTRGHCADTCFLLPYSIALPGAVSNRKVFATSWRLLSTCSAAAGSTEKVTGGLQVLLRLHFLRTSLQGCDLALCRSPDNADPRRFNFGCWWCSGCWHCKQSWSGGRAASLPHPSEA